MAFLRNTAEGGSSGLDATLANTGGASGNVFGIIVEEGTTNVSFQSAAALHGGLGYRVVPDPTTVNKCYVGLTFASSRFKTSTRWYFRFGAFPNAGGTAVILLWSNSSDTGQRASIRMSPTGIISVQNAAVSVVFTATAPLSINTTYRMEVSLDATTGSMVLRVFLGNSLTPITGTSADLVGQSFGGASGTSHLLFGYRTILVGAGTLDFDEIAVDDTTLDLLGPAGLPEIALTAEFIGSGVVRLTWTHPGDAPAGVTLARAPGLQTTDGNARPPYHPQYNPMTIPGAVMLASGLTGASSPYLDSLVPLGSWTYWIARTA